MITSVRNTQTSRIGFHYFPDTLHYQESDLRTWLPELQALNAGWLTLIAPTNRAIPEAFITGLIENHIQPIIHFKLPIQPATDPESLKLFLKAYSEWGVKYIVLFDRPNTRTAWDGNGWVQASLVERFLDAYIPLASQILQAGMQPVFPPLEPGGDYWDTAFLRAALQGLHRRGHEKILENLVLSAYARFDTRPLNWGAGGPERWPGARPYFTPVDQQDQRGFYIFDWYLAVARAIIPTPLSLILLGVGSPTKGRARLDLVEHTRRHMAIAHLLANSADSADPVDTESGELSPISSKVIACNFWLLASGEESVADEYAWYQSDGDTLPIVTALRQWYDSQPGFSVSTPKTAFPKPHPLIGQSISHYLLLPSYEWGIAEWHLDVIRPFVVKHRPTIGFSLEEASHAERVTVIGGQGSFPEDELERLRSTGCDVERISGDGTSIATQLASK